MAKKRPKYEQTGLPAWYDPTQERGYGSGAATGKEQETEKALGKLADRLRQETSSGFDRGFQQRVERLLNRLVKEQIGEKTYGVQPDQPKGSDLLDRGIPKSTIPTGGQTHYGVYPPGLQPPYEVLEPGELPPGHTQTTPPSVKRLFNPPPRSVGTPTAPIPPATPYGVSSATSAAQIPGANPPQPSSLPVMSAQGVNQPTIGFQAPAGSWGGLGGPAPGQPYQPGRPGIPNPQGPPFIVGPTPPPKPPGPPGTPTGTVGTQQGNIPWVFPVGGPGGPSAPSGGGPAGPTVISYSPGATPPPTGRTPPPPTPPGSSGPSPGGGRAWRGGMGGAPLGGGPQVNAQMARIMAALQMQFGIDLGSSQLMDPTKVKQNAEWVGKQFSEAGMEGIGGGISKTGKALDLAQKIPRAMAGDPVAIAELGKEGLDMVKKRLKTMKEETLKTGEEFKKAIGSERLGETAGHLFGAGEHFGKAMGGPVGKLIEHFSKLGKALAESLDKLRDWSKQLHEANMRFAEFSGAMSAVQAEQDVRDILLSQERGERRAESAKYLAESKHRLEKAVTPLEDTWANIKNWVTGFIDQKVADILEPLTFMAERMGFVTPGSGPSGINRELFDLMDRNEQQDALRRLGIPDRFHELYRRHML